MPKELYEDAIADVKKIAEVAEDSVKQELLETLAPRIKQLVENELFKSPDEDDDENLLFDDDPVVMPHVEQGAAEQSADAISAPDAEGKVTLDLDALSQCDCDHDDELAPVPGEEPEQPAGLGVPGVENEFVLGLEGADALAKLRSMTLSGKQFAVIVKEMHKKIASFKGASSLIRESKGYQRQIARMISNVEDMYDYVQGTITDPNTKQRYQLQLENFFSDLTKLREHDMSNRKTRLILEDDESQLDFDDAGAESDDADLDLDTEGDEDGELTLKLTGLPDDVDLDDVGVDLISGGEEEDMDLDAGGDEETGTDDDGDLEMVGDDEGAEEDEGEELSMEALMRLPDDTIVEIDERQLQREVARLKRLREADERPADANGMGVGAEEMDDFGGGSDDGEPFLDGEVTTEGDDMDMPMEGDDMCEEDDMSMVELQNRRMGEERGSRVADGHFSESRKLRLESRMRRNLMRRARKLKLEARSASSKSLSDRYSRMYRSTVKKINESFARSSELRAMLAERQSLQGKRSNSAPQRQIAESSAVKNLRKELAQKNLDNRKLAYSNKLLQLESLTKTQKANALDRLNAARTLREVKIAYESVVKAAARKPLSEGARGSSSRTVSSSSADKKLLSEGYEIDRWAQLANLKR